MPHLVAALVVASIAVPVFAQQPYPERVVRQIVAKAKPDGHGSFATAKTPLEVIAKLHDELVQFTRAADMKAAYTQQGIELTSSSPAELAQILKAEVAKYQTVTRNITVQMD